MQKYKFVILLNALVLDYIENKLWSHKPKLQEN